MRLIAAGEMGSARCVAVWNVDGVPVVQPISDLSVPPGWGVLPVRRIGTHRQATSSIAMYPVMRDGFRLMLLVESKLELAWVQQLDIHASVSAIHAQPFAMVWIHEQGQLFQVPDLAAVIDGNLTVFEVKPAHRAQDEWSQAKLGLMRDTLWAAGMGFRVLSDVTAQRAHNLQQITRWRDPNPWAADDVSAVLDVQPTSIGGIAKVVDVSAGAMSGGRGQFDVDVLRRTYVVAMHLLATGRCSTDLDAPLSLGSELRWHLDGEPGRWWG